MTNQFKFETLQSKTAKIDSQDQFLILNKRISKSLKFMRENQFLLTDEQNTKLQRNLDQIKKLTNKRTFDDTDELRINLDEFEFTASTVEK